MSARALPMSSHATQPPLRLASNIHSCQQAQYQCEADTKSREGANSSKAAAPSVHIQPLCPENGEKTPRKHPRKHPGGYRPHSCKYDGNHAPSEYLEVYGCDVLFTVLFMFCVSDFYVGKETVITPTAAVSEHYDFCF